MTSSRYRPHYTARPASLRKQGSERRPLQAQRRPPRPPDALKRGQRLPTVAIFCLIRFYWLPLVAIGESLHAIIKPFVYACFIGIFGMIASDKRNAEQMLSQTLALALADFGCGRDSVG